MCAGQDRLAGYRQAMPSAGRARDPAPGRRTAGSASPAGRPRWPQLLAATPDIDAVFAASDLTAVGAMRAIEAAGRRVRDDIAVVGFDDIGDAELAHPALTTVRQPIAEMGRTMATRLLQRIAGEQPPLRTVLPVELIHGDRLTRRAARPTPISALATTNWRDNLLPRALTCPVRTRILAQS